MDLRPRLDIGDAVNVYDKIFFQDYDKHPLLKSIIIKFGDNEHLVGLTGLLLYFHQHYKKLFVERKLYLPHFQTIEIEIDTRWAPSAFHRFDKTTNQEFFGQERNKEYSIDCKTIEIKSSELTQGIESFGTFYKNVLYWWQRREDKFGTIIFRIE